MTLKNHSSPGKGRERDGSCTDGPNAFDWFTWFKKKAEYEAVKEKHKIVHDHILKRVDYVKIKTTPKANRNSKTWLDITEFYDAKTNQRSK